MFSSGFTKRLKVSFWVGLILVAFIAVFMYFKATKPETQPVEIKQKVWPVNVMPVKLARLATSQSLYGQVESSSLVTVSAPVNGVVSKVNVWEGDNIKTGQILVAMADSDLNLPLQIAKAELKDAKAQNTIENLAYEANQKRLEHEKKVLQIKRKALTRNQQLLKKNLTSQADIDASKEALVRQEFQVVGARLSVSESKARLDQMQAREDKAQANLEQAQVNVTRGVLKAPFNGRVAEVTVSEGNRVAVGGQLLSFYGLDSLELRAQIPVGQLAEVYQSLSSGQPLFATYEINGQSFQLPLKRLAGESSASGVDAFFGLPEKLKITRPGDVMQVSLMGAKHDNVFAVPYSALFGANRLYLLEDNKLRGVTVKKIGETSVDGEVQVLVQADLAEVPDGALVMTTHLPNAVSGLNVMVSE